MNYFNVAVKAPLFRPLVYQSDNPLVSVGQVVQVPLGSRTVSGLVLSSLKSTDRPVNDPINSFEIKDILSVESAILPLSSVRIKWIQWLSDYYLHPIGLTSSLCYSLKKFKVKKNEVKKLDPPSSVQNFL